MALRFSGIFHQAQEPFVPGLAKLHLKEKSSGFFALALFQQLFGLRNQSIAKHRLLPHQLFDKRLKLVVLVGRDRCRSADDQRRPSFVDQDGIDFIDDRVVVTALDLLFLCGRHPVITQVVEPELAVGSVRDVAIVLLLADRGRLVVLNASDGEPEQFVDFTHPFRVTTSQVIVNGHEVNATPGKSVEVNRTGRDESFTLTGRHFSNLAFVQHNPADELNIEMDHVPDDRLVTDKDGFAAEPARRILYEGERLGQNRVQTACKFVRIIDVRQIFFPLSRFFPELIFSEGLKLLFQLVDLFDKRANSS